MTASTEVIIEQIDALLHQHGGLRSQSKYDDLSDLPDSMVTEVVIRLASAVRRFAPGGTTHQEGADSIVKRYSVSNGHCVEPLVGILKALRADYAAGYLVSVEELIHADLFADFLEMADHLLSQGYKDPAAVMAGSVLEEHLRKLSLKSGMSAASGGVHKKADLINAELASANVYSKLDLKSITAWLDLRNKAAHGHYSEYTKEQVQLMLDGVRNFLSRHTA